MIWLAWRQLRTQVLVAVVGLAVFAAYLVYLGFRIRHDYLADVVNCVPSDCASSRRLFADRYVAQVSLLGLLLLALPGIVGAFWGAPLVARELETKTDLLVWNQSVTRGRWLAVKLLVVGAAAVAVSGAFSLLLTWSVSRYDQWAGDRFAAMSFAARNVVPLGYAAFAFVLGVLVGLLVRRTVPAMAIVLAVFAALQVVVPTAVRSHLLPPVSSTVAFNGEAMQHAHGFGMSPETGASIVGYVMPGTWPMDSQFKVFNADGTPYTSTQSRQCMTGTPDKDFECMTQQNLHFSYTYQPGSRYWPFQWIELSAYTLLALLLAGVSFLWIRRRVS
ncbi:ABC transporter permease subunit [Dactylosporangium sp. NPDC005572]|uniref:ABC transporter permease subunit n=1 Tax=Dactylosporangium sp. NPDC005572 TaxID=3156889 RepID=UPI0033B3D7A8